MIEVTYIDFNGATDQGHLVIHSDHAEALVTVFGRLYEAGYPIASITPIGQLPHAAEDQPGYSNTSGFHCRFVEGTDRWSEHAMGRAVDINPHLNPFIRGDEIWPIGSEIYVDRSLESPGMISEGDLVVSAFDSIGWEWGGRWRTLKDYHHFSSTGR